MLLLAICLLMLEGYLAHTRFISPCDVLIGNMLEGNIAYARFISQCNVANLQMEMCLCLC